MSIEQVNGFGMSTGAELNDLNKALSAGYATTPETQQNGGAFRVESLDNSLKVLTYSDQHIKFWKSIPKTKAFNTVEEYNQLLSYGSEGGGFLTEGELPGVQDSVYQRKAAFVKFMGVTREVTHPMTLVNSAHGDVINRMNQDGILWLLKKIENGLFWGNSKLAANGAEGVEFDGLDTMIDPVNVVDLKGQHLEEKHMNWGAQMIIENYGTPTDIYLPYEVFGQFSQEFFPKERVIMPTQGGYQAGVVVDKFQTHGGPVNFTPNQFLKKTKELVMAANNNQAPAQPTSVTAALGAAGGDFAKSGAGTYVYYVTAVNRHGESAPTRVTADVVLTGADLQKKVDLTITNAATSIYPVEYYQVYRTEADGKRAFAIGKVGATSNVASAVTTFTDVNDTMPNTYTAFMGQMTEDVLTFRQLAPMMKMDLATLAPSYRWMILLYGVPVLFAPRKWMRFKNIKAELYNG
ncbi:hypothetical protein D3C74_50680 [compost metagenome]